MWDLTWTWRLAPNESRPGSSGRCCSQGRRRSCERHQPASRPSQPASQPASRTSQPPRPAAPAGRPGQPPRPAAPASRPGPHLTAAPGAALSSESAGPARGCLSPSAVITMQSDRIISRPRSTDCLQPLEADSEPLPLSGAWLLAARVAALVLSSSATEGGVIGEGFRLRARAADERLPYFLPAASRLLLGPVAADWPPAAAADWPVLPLP
jgi:hypothetical protein